MIIDRLRRGVAATITLGLAAAALVWAPAAAAAPPYETEATLHAVQFVQESTGTGWQAQLQGEWSLPDDPTTPAGFVVELPEGLRGLTDAFDLLDPEGVTLGACTVTAMQIVCDFDAAYLAAHPRNLGGTFFFWVEVTTEVTETTEVTYDFAGVSATVTVAGPGEPCADCTFDGKGNGKWGWYDRDRDAVLWGVEIAARREGSVGGATVTVLERLGERQDWVRTTAGVPDLHVVGTNEVDADGYPTFWRTVDDRVGMTRVETAAGVEVSFTTEEGWFYAVHGWTSVTDGGGAGTYSNEADVTIAASETQTVRAHVVRHAGGGTGSGDDVGRFSITKRVDGVVAAVAGLTYRGTYIVTAPGGAETAGTFAVAADATWTSPPFEAGSTVVLAESAPDGPVGVDWATPVFSDDEVTVSGGETVAVTLTNRAALALGTFSAAKVLTGTGASLIDADAVFTLTYAYPAGAGYPAGSGTLDLPADGRAVTSPAIPVGAVVTVSEVAPDGVAGATWTGSVVSASVIEIARGDVPHITVTNTITANAATPTPVPSVGVLADHVDGTPEVLAHTGGTLPIAALLLGGLAVLIGAALRSRRRATRV